MQTRFKLVEFRPSRWHIVNKKTNVPIYDDALYGKDKTLVIK